MIIRKNDSKLFLIIYCINIKTLLILINYQKGHTILIKKNDMIKKKKLFINEKTSKSLKKITNKR